MLDGELQILKHAEGFVFELDQGIALANRAEVNTGTHDIKSIDVIHPEAVNNLKSKGPLDITNGWYMQAGILSRQLI